MSFVKSNHKNGSLVSIIIASAGNATRLRLNKSKLFLELGNKPLIFYSLDKFLQLENLLEIVIVSNDIKETKNLIKEYSDEKIKIVTGGPLRQDSVLNGFNALEKIPDLVIIHDVGRPFFEMTDLKNCIRTAEESGAGILAIKAVDTIKKAISNNDKLYVSETLQREELYQIQTPQVFSYELLAKAYDLLKSQKEKVIVTDEAKMIELLGNPVNLVSGSKKNIKITYEEDLEIANAILNIENEKRKQEFLAK